MLIIHYNHTIFMIVVDVETTGLDPRKNSIVSVGALDMYNPKNQFYKECKIWDGAEVSDMALKINGFSREEITNPNKESLDSLVNSFIDWTKDIPNATIAGENPSFDRDFLKYSAKMYGIDWKFTHRTIDMHSICYAHQEKRGLSIPLKNSSSNLNSGLILNYVGLPEEPMPHNALMGAKMEAEAFSRLIYGKILLEEFEEHPIPEYLL